MAAVRWPSVPRAADSAGPGVAPELAFLTGSQGLLVWGTHFTTDQTPGSETWLPKN